MTIPYTIERIWEGETVVVIGNADKMTAAIANKYQSFRSIAVNRAVKFAPWADILVSIDGNWPKEGENFAGVRIVGNTSEIDAGMIDFPRERVSLQTGTVLHIRNNSISAIRLAADLGASKIVLVGFDPAAYEKKNDFSGFAVALDALITELREKWISVEMVSLLQDRQPKTTDTAE